MILINNLKTMDIFIQAEEILIDLEHRRFLTAADKPAAYLFAQTFLLLKKISQSNDTEQNREGGLHGV